jgi:hypothetical protein
MVLMRCVELCHKDVYRRWIIIIKVVSVDGIYGFTCDPNHILRLFLL